MITCKILNTNVGADPNCKGPNLGTDFVPGKMVFFPVPIPQTVTNSTPVSTVWDQCNSVPMDYITTMKSGPVFGPENPTEKVAYPTIKEQPKAKVGKKCEVAMKVPKKKDGVGKVCQMGLLARVENWAFTRHYLTQPRVAFITFV